MKRLFCLFAIVAAAASAGTLYLPAYPAAVLVFDESKGQIVDRIPNQQSQFVGNGLVLFEPYYALSGFQIVFENKLARATLEEFGYLPIEIADVLISPFKFELCTSAGINGH